jgi:hypothetical protein
VSTPDPASAPGPGAGRLAQEEADSRIFGGIHFRFDNEASQTYCTKVPEFTAEHFILPRWP